MHDILVWIGITAQGIAVVALMVANVRRERAIRAFVKANPTLRRES